MLVVCFLALFVAGVNGNTLILGDSWGEFIGNSRPGGLGTSQICSTQTVINNAIGGMSAEDLNNDFGSQTDEVSNPSAITKIWLTIGGNDYLNACESGESIEISEIKTRVQSVINKAVAEFPNAQIALTGYTTPPSSCDSSCWPESRASALAAMYQQLGTENTKVTYFNIQRLLGSSGAGSPSDSQYYQDCVHVNDGGYIKLFDGTSFGDFLCPIDGFADFDPAVPSSAVTAGVQSVPWFVLSILLKN